jgi:hypothetical protein
MKLHQLTVAAVVGLASQTTFADGVGVGTASQAQAQSIAPSNLPPIVIYGQRPDIEHRDPTEDLGSPGSPDTADKVLHIDAGTKYTNVVQGESIEFVAPSGNGTQKAFVWRFDGWPRNAIDLTKVAPAGFLDHKVLVYVSPDPASLGG